MAPQTQAEPAVIPQQYPRWKPITRVLFRFCFAYFGLYALTTQIIQGLMPLPIDVPDPILFPPIRATVQWVATHIFHISQVSFQPSGSGDKTIDFLLNFCVLCAALVSTAIWSALDRRREAYPSLHKWFHLAIRVVVATQFLSYGTDKLVPLQMPYPPLWRLVEPYGNFSPMGVLWSSIGASTAYEMFVGSAEILGAVLLLFPRTAFFGALVCLADAIEVFTLNMTYDVPVKLFSFHLLLMSLVLLAPEFRRMLAFFFSDRAVSPPARVPLFGTPRKNRIAVIAQVVYGLAMISVNLYISHDDWYKYGPGNPASVLYGIWNLDQPTADWQRIIFDRAKQFAIQRPDASFARYQAAIDEKAATITLTGSDKKIKATLHYSRPAPDRLTIDGNLEDHPLHQELHLMDRSKFLLVSRGFHWIQEVPFNK